MAALLRIAVLVAIAVWACGDTTTTLYCAYHSDCPEEGRRYCVNGICRVEECQDDRDCSEGLLCVEGGCEEG